MLHEIRSRQQTVQRILETRDRPLGYFLLKIEKVLPQLERAVEKIIEGTYGSCDDCSNTIPEKRLAAVPGATRCTPCQTLFEDSRH